MENKQATVTDAKLTPGRSKGSSSEEQISCIFGIVLAITGAVLIGVTVTISRDVLAPMGVVMLLAIGCLSHAIRIWTKRARERKKQNIQAANNLASVGSASVFGDGYRNLATEQNNSGSNAQETEDMIMNVLRAYSATRKFRNISRSDQLHTPPRYGTTESQPHKIMHDC